MLDQKHELGTYRYVGPEDKITVKQVLRILLGTFVSLLKQGQFVRSLSSQT
jgi:hypothetical protein